MAVITEVGNFTPSTGNVTVNLSNFGGETPKLVLLQTSLGSGVNTSNGGMSMGFIDGYGNQGTIGTSTQHAVTTSNTRRVIYNDKCIAAYRLQTSPGTIGPVGDMSVGADLFSGVFTGADYGKIGYLAIGDDGSGDVDAEIYFGTAPTSNSSQNYTFSNVEPNVLFMITAGLSSYTSGSHGNFGFGMCVQESGVITQHAMGLGSLTASADSQTKRLNSPNHIICYPFNGAVLEEAAVTAISGSQVTLNWSETNAIGRTFALIGLKIPAAKLVRFNTNGFSSQNIETGGVDSKGALIASLISGDPGSGVQSGARISLGLTDETNSFTCGYTDQDASADTVCSRWTYTDAVLQASTDAATQTLKSTVVVGETSKFSYSPTDSDGDEVVGLFFGDEVLYSVGDITNVSVNADGLTWLVDLYGMSSSITQIESGKSITGKVGSVNIPLTFSSAAEIAGPAVLHDTFTGTNGDDVNGRTPDTTQPGSATWVEDGPSTGDLGINTNRASVIANGTLAAKNLTIDTGLTDCTIEAKIYCGSSTNRFYYIYLRYVDSNNWVRLKIQARGSSQILEQNNAGSISTLATSSTPHTTVFNQTDTWLITISGTSVDVEVTGHGSVLSGSTFSLHTTDTHQGWGVEADKTNGALNEFKVSEISSARITLTGDSLVVAGETFTLNADAATFNDGSNTSNAITGAGVTNNSTQSPEYDINISSMTLSDSDTIQLSLLTENVKWGDLSLDANDVSVWAETGFGHPSISSIDGSSSGYTATVNLNLDRTPYNNELYEIETRTGWLGCSRGNSGVIDWSNLAKLNLDLTGGASPPATTTVISNGRTAITLDTAAAVSFYQDGVPAIVVPTSNSVVAEYPDRTVDASGYVINGAVYNGDFYNTQAFDERARTYNDSNLVALSGSVLPGGSYVKVSSEAYDDIDNIDGATTSWNSHIRSYGLYQFVSSAPSSNEFSPPVWGYAGSGRPTLTLSNLSSIVSSLPSKTLTGLGQTPPDLNDILKRFGQSNVGRIVGENDFSRELIPTYFTDAEGYGRNQSITMANALIHLMGDEATTAQKTHLVKWLIHHGIQLYYSMVGRGDYIDENGGLEQGYAAAVISSLNWLNKTSSLSSLPSTLGMNELRQCYYWDAEEQARYNNLHQAGDADGYPLTSEYNYTRRVFNIDDVTGNIITVNSGTTLHQFYYEHIYTGWHFTDGTNDAEITGYTRFDNAFVVDDPTGFTPGSSGWLVGYSGVPAIGTPDWGIVNTTDPSRNAYAGTDSAYRFLSTWSMQILFLEYLRFHTGFGNDAWRDECRLANNNPNYLNSYVPSPKRHETAFAEVFWSGYNADALAIAESTPVAASSGTYSLTLTDFNPLIHQILQIKFN